MTRQIRFTVNGQEEALDVPTHLLLSAALRERLHLTGTKRGCETGVCGACSVLVDGRLVKSCLMLAWQADGAELRTVEGLAQGDRLHPLQESFMTCGGLQCGYCTPGMLMAALELVEQQPDAQREQVREWMSGNYCRCTGYHAIVDAVCAVLEQQKAGRFADEPVEARA